MSKKDKGRTQKVTVEIPSDEELLRLGFKPAKVKDMLQRRALVIGAAVDAERPDEPVEEVPVAS